MDAPSANRWTWISGAVQVAAGPALIALIGITLAFWHQVGITFSELAATDVALKTTDQALSEGLAKLASTVADMTRQMEILKAEDADIRLNLTAINEILRDRIHTCGRDLARVEAKLDGLQGLMELHGQMHHKQGQ